MGASDSHDLWRVQFDAPDGKVVGTWPLENSTRIENTPVYSPDGQWLCDLLESLRALRDLVLQGDRP